MINDRPVFDSRNEFYRAPFGAVDTGTEVKITVTPPRDIGICYAAVHVTYEFDGNRTEEFPLTWDGHFGKCDLYRGIIPTSGYLGPIWYYFRFDRVGTNTLYYGNSTGLGGQGEFCDSNPASYQITVFDNTAMKVPRWYGRGVTYHIFPDRFNKAGRPVSVKGMVGDRVLHENWEDCPDFLPDRHGEIRNRDFFGGNLEGVREKLPYLQSLGVTTIYFSPIFEAASNHRYDTADYHKLDPLFGDEKQFERFCEEAGKLGMRVMLDGVFNHTGFDSVYFNGRGTYPGKGAYQAITSKYYNWYDFQDWPHRYSSWWGIYTLPQINESHPDYIKFIVEDKNSVVRRWLRMGASGWRLDVADELPDEFIEKLCASAREEKEDAVIIGEVWEDASNKIAYSVRRKYLLGRELDGVMNYPFRDAVFSYLLEGDAKRFMDTVEHLRENYPRPAFYSLMNIVGTHDTPRALTVFGAEGHEYSLPKTEKANLRLSPERLERAVRRLKIASAIQFCFPGSPCVFYGDEAGMQGFEDPFNRRCYPWGKENQELIAWYRKLGALRKDSSALQDGELRFIEAESSVLAFERTLVKEKVVFVSNCDSSPNTIILDWEGEAATDLISDKIYNCEKGKLSIKIPPMTAMILK